MRDEKWKHQEHPLHVVLAILAATFEVLVTKDTVKQIEEMRQSLTLDFVDFEPPMSGLL